MIRSATTAERRRTSSLPSTDGGSGRRRPTGTTRRTNPGRLRSGREQRTRGQQVRSPARRPTLQALSFPATSGGSRRPRAGAFAVSSVHYSLPTTAAVKARDVRNRSSRPRHGARTRRRPAPRRRRIRRPRCAGSGARLRRAPPRLGARLLFNSQKHGPRGGPPASGRRPGTQVKYTARPAMSSNSTRSRRVQASRHSRRSRCERSPPVRNRPRDGERLRRPRTMTTCPPIPSSERVLLEPPVLRRGRVDRCPAELEDALRASRPGLNAPGGSGLRDTAQGRPHARRPPRGRPRSWRHAKRYAAHPTTIPIHARPRDERRRDVTAVADDAQEPHLRHVPRDQLDVEVVRRRLLHDEDRAKFNARSAAGPVRRSHAHSRFAFVPPPRGRSIVDGPVSAVHAIPTSNSVQRRDVSREQRRLLRPDDPRIRPEQVLKPRGPAPGRADERDDRHRTLQHHFIIRRSNATLTPTGTVSRQPR